MTNVLTFQRSPAMEPAVAALMPSPEEITSALFAIDHAMVALGLVDFEGLAERVKRAQVEARDAEPDNDADAAAVQRRVVVELLIAAGTFRLLAGIAAQVRAVSTEGGR